MTVSFLLENFSKGPQQYQQELILNFAYAKKWEFFYNNIEISITLFSIKVNSKKTQFS